MSWSLSASGHADNHEAERRLAEALGQVLKDAGPVVSSASFGGSSYGGDPRLLAKPNGDEQA
jgi:hypothetical protein